MSFSIKTREYVRNDPINKNERHKLSFHFMEPPTERYEFIFRVTSRDNASRGMLCFNGNDGQYEVQIVDVKVRDVDGHRRTLYVSKSGSHYVPIGTGPTHTLTS
jgi:hypothetical protein